MRPVLVDFAPGSGMIDPIRGSGDAFLYVLAGEITVEVEGADPYVLGEGGTAYLLGNQARLYRNPSAAPARLLTVVVRH